MKISDNVIPEYKWQQLKETITEIKDNNEFEKDDVTVLYRFLLNYMGVLEDENNNRNRRRNL